MDSSSLFYIIIGILILQFILETFLDYLNASRFQDPVPGELQDIFDETEYKKAQSYKKTNYRFGLVSSVFSLVLTLAFLIFGGV